MSDAALERSQASFGKCLAEGDIELGDGTYVQGTGPLNLTFHFGGVRVLAVMDQLHLNQGALPLEPANGDVDRVGTRPRHQAHDQARWLDAPLQEVGEWIRHQVRVHQNRQKPPGTTP